MQIAERTLNYTDLPVKTKFHKDAIPTLLTSENPKGQLPASLRYEKQNLRRSQYLRRGLY